MDIETLRQRQAAKIEKVNKYNTIHSKAWNLQEEIKV